MSLKANNFQRLLFLTSLDFSDLLAAFGHSPGGSGHRAGAVARRVSTRLETPFRVGVRVAHWLRTS